MPLPLAVQLHTFRDPARFGGTGHGLDPATLRGIAEAGFLAASLPDMWRTTDRDTVLAALRRLDEAATASV